MLSTLILATTEAAHAVTAEPGMLEKFGVETKYVIFQAISFLILFAVLYYKAIKPTIGAMEERQAKVDAGMKHAAEMKAKLDATQVETLALIKQAQLDAAKIVEEARVSAKTFIERQTQDATVRAQDIIAKAQQATELEHRRMIAEARGEIARLVVATTRQVLAKELSEDERSRYNAAAAKELSIA
jgi:F-type H+-transporting ATPase subunit b